MANPDNPESPNPFYNIEEEHYSEMEDQKMVSESDCYDKRAMIENDQVDEDLQYQNGWLLRR